MTRAAAASRARVAICATLLAGLLGASAPLQPARAATDSPVRLVVLKVDGLSQETVDRFVDRVDPATGRYALPWIRRLFYDAGVRLENYYARGISLSEPSWAIIDTGREPVIKGNFETDRRTGWASDHLNTISLYYEVAKKRRVYPDGVEALDEAGIPLVSDAFRFEERETGIQLLRRGTKFYDFLEVGLGPVKGSLAERFGDLLVGVDFKRSFFDTTRKSFLDAVADPAKRYVDYYDPAIDEELHDDATDGTLLHALQALDRVIGEAHAALEANDTLDRTVLVVVSDHGQTYDAQGGYSQGINLIAYLSRPEFGAHNVYTRSAVRSTYDLKGSMVNPNIPGPIVTPSRQSIYLAHRPDQVTCAFDFDGNERAQLQFRDPDLNRLEMLHQTIRARTIAARLRDAAANEALAILDRRRGEWRAEAAALREQLTALAEIKACDAAEIAEHRRWLAPRLEAAKAAQPAPPIALAPFSGRSKLNLVDGENDLKQRIRELEVEIDQIDRDLALYGAYCTALELRVALDSPSAFRDAAEAKLFPPRDLGRRLSVFDLVDYPVGLDAVVAPDGSPTLRFATVDYLELFSELRVRNAVRRDIGSKPVDFVAARIPVVDVARELVAAGMVESDLGRIADAVLVYASRDAQLLLVTRRGSSGLDEILAVPITNLEIDAAARRVRFERAAWRDGLPLRLFEDSGLDTGREPRAEWLARFHPDREWLAAVHATDEGLAVIGLPEAFSTAFEGAFARVAARAATRADKLRTEFALSRRLAMESDLFVAASRLWNFDLKDFNPYGNHGGFRRQSMHALFWLHGGRRTRIAKGPLVVAPPFDALDVAPTLFEAAEISTDGAMPVLYRDAGFANLPGRAVRDAFGRSDE